MEALLTPIRNRITVFDNVLPDPVAYRTQALGSPFRTFDFGKIFHGIAAIPIWSEVPDWISARFPHLTPKVTFLRRSPLGQEEPNFVHTDVDIGEWTGIFYMNPDPPPEDGTLFWKHRATGEIQATPEFSRESEWNHSDKWERWQYVSAAFNRLLLFPAPYFHSRAILQNYGAGDGARLIQVVFGTGSL